jgi:hypothetical protein
MDFAQPTMNTYPAELLGQQFQVSGNLVPLGEPLGFMNDAQRGTVVIEDATATPLQPGWKAGEFSSSKLIVPKSQVQLMLIGEINPEEDMRLFPRTEHLIVYTDTYVVSGHFHAGSDTPVPDLFHSSGGPYFPASKAEIYSIVPLTISIGGSAPIVFVNKNHIKAYYQKD